MAHQAGMFSSDWHRVAKERVALRPTVRIRKQLYRGKQWYLIHDPFSNNFFRIAPQGYRFVCRLNPNETVEEVWEKCLERDGDQAPGQEEVIQLLTQLYLSNLLYSAKPADTSALFTRYERRRKRDQRSKLMSLLFMRIPLFDPDRFLQRVAPFMGILMGPLGVVLWLAVVGLAIKVVVDNLDAFLGQTQGLLAPGNLFLLYLGILLVKAMHELGHALVCRYFGGEVHTMGVMLLVFSPLPYMDATSSWSFRSRWQRALVGASGMLVELFVAALMVFVWAGSGQGTIHSLAYNIIFVASASTILFNINPLLRLDGYYILSDFLDVPNLHARAQKQLIYACERYLFGVQGLESQADSLRGSVGLVLIGLASHLYRVLIMCGIIFMVIQKFFLLGLLLTASLMVTVLVLPPVKLFGYLMHDRKLVRNRPRAWAVTLGVLLALVLLVGVVPSPDRFRAPGVLQATEHIRVINRSAGYLEKVLTPTGTQVEAGDALVQLADPDLDMDIMTAQAKWLQLLAAEQKAGSENVADLMPIQEQKKNITAMFEELTRRKQDLKVRARQDGIWVAPALAEEQGAWLARGSELGLIINPGSFRFLAVVPQMEASRLFDEKILGGEVRLRGQAQVDFPVRTDQIVPVEKEFLPSAALGWYGGGGIAVSAKDGSGLRTLEPFFQVSVDLGPDRDVQLYHGQTGVLRLTTPSKPLLWQWVRRFRQMLQTRYQL